MNITTAYLGPCSEFMRSLKVVTLRFSTVEWCTRCKGKQVGFGWLRTVVHSMAECVANRRITTFKKTIYHQI